jgi:hypothetical protein
MEGFYRIAARIKGRREGEQQSADSSAVTQPSE